VIYQDHQSLLRYMLEASITFAI